MDRELLPLNPMKISQCRVLVPVFAIAGVLSVSVAKADTYYSIGNSGDGPATGEFAISGQGFNPSVQGDNGTGTPTAGDGGNVYLQSFSFGFGQNVTPLTDGSSELFIYSSSVPVTDTGFANPPFTSTITVDGIGAYLDLGIWNSGGDYFNFTSGINPDGLLLNFNSDYFAVLQFSNNINETLPVGPGVGLYSGGDNLFDPGSSYDNGDNLAYPASGNVEDEANGYDAVFTANFEAVPDTGNSLVLLAGALGVVAVLSRRIRRAQIA